MALEDYEHPAAVPLAWTAVGAVMVLINAGAAIGGDWMSVAIVLCGLFMGFVGGRDLVRRWRRGRA